MHQKESIKGIYSWCVCVCVFGHTAFECMQAQDTCEEMRKCVCLHFFFLLYGAGEAVSMPAGFVDRLC